MTHQANGIAQVSTRGQKDGTSAGRRCRPDRPVNRDRIELTAIALGAEVTNVEVGANLRGLGNFQGSSAQLSSGSRIKDYRARRLQKITTAIFLVHHETFSGCLGDTSSSYLLQ